MHGAHEANMVMHDCDVMFNIGARFDDRVTGKVDAFSPDSKKVHIDIDPSSLNKNVSVDIGIIGDAASVLEDILAIWDKKQPVIESAALKGWWKQIDEWQGELLGL